MGDSKERSPGKIISQQGRVLLHRAPSKTPTSDQVPHASARHHLLEPSVGKAPSLRALVSSAAPTRVSTPTLPLTLKARGVGMKLKNGEPTPTLNCTRATTSLT